MKTYSNKQILRSPLKKTGLFLALLLSFGSTAFAHDYKNAPAVWKPNLPEVPIYTPAESDSDSYYAAPKTRASFPAVYRSEDADLITPVKDQGDFGTCWAFSALSACETSMIKRGLSDTSLDLSELHLAHFFYHTQPDPLGGTAGDVNRLVFGNYMDIGGSDICTIFALAKWTGAASESLAPYPSTNNIPSLNSALAYQDIGHLQNTRYVTGLDTNSIKQLLMEYGALSISIYMDSDFINEENGAFNCNRFNDDGYPYIANHQVVLTGWDDTYSRENFPEAFRPSSDGAWIVKNSYGDAYGDNGYIHISYEDKVFHSKDSLVFAYDMESSDNYTHNYQYDGSASSVYRYFTNGNTGSMANIFTVKGNPGGQERLEAVSFALASQNVQYAIQIYKNPSSTNPASGIPVFDTAQTGVTTHCGYYTIPLKETVVFNQGDRFSVVVSITASKGKRVYFFTDEADQMNDGDIRFITKAAKGQSFLKAGGSRLWEDFGVTEKGNVRIKAFTTDTTEPATIVLPNVSELPPPVVNPLQISSCTKLSVSWSPVTYADFYTIYRSTQKKGVYQEIGRTASTFWTDANLTAGKTYYYKIKAHTVARRGELYSPYSSVKSKKLVPPKVTFSSLKKKGKTQAALTWKRISDADGYEIYRKLPGKKWKKIETIKKSSTVQYKNKLSKTGTTQYKICAYKKSGKKKIRGAYSKIRKIKK